MLRLGYNQNGVIRVAAHVDKGHGNQVPSRGGCLATGHLDNPDSHFPDPEMASALVLDRFRLGLARSGTVCQTPGPWNHTTLHNYTDSAIQRPSLSRRPVGCNLLKLEAMGCSGDRPRAKNSPMG